MLVKGKANGNEKIALKAGIWYVISSVLVRMVSVITTPIFTRLLSTDEYGVVSIFTSWYSTLFVVYTLNLALSIGRAKLDYPDKLDDYIGSIQVLAFIVSCILSAILFIFINPVSKFFELSKSATVLLLIYLIAAPSISFYQSGYRYKYKYKENIAIAWYTTIATSVLSIILISNVDYDKSILRILGLVLPSVVLSILFWINSIKKGNIKVNLNFWKYGLLISLPLVVHSISMNILSQSDRIVISKFCDGSYVAYYSLVQNYAIFLSVVTDAINQAWQPWFHDHYYAHKTEEIKKNTNLLVILICFMGLACISIGPEAIYILGGNQYSIAVSCIPPLVLGIVCQCIYTNYINIELHLKKTKYAAEGTVIAALLNIVLNIVFVPIFGYSAAAYTTYLSYFVLLVLHYLITRKSLKVSLYNDKFLFFAMFITSLVGFSFLPLYEYTYIRWGVIAIGFACFLITFRRFIFEFLKKLRRSNYRT